MAQNRSEFIFAVVAAAVLPFVVLVTLPLLFVLVVKEGCSELDVGDSPLRVNMLHVKKVLNGST
ncbi:hypothetical protein [Stenomitos frigidus]|uniref:Uncharacterized protein n=1 Tax=Stenomitos frigidus ULC18 TaxID=2107698 RepID=A0A2T1EEW4_9CYAN|nr:hypothetical protein [Stenomitos frigidus]PSB31233.1 hypothetical protein C7B82_07635 [Stenomitos frigidus ULC18]